MSGLLKDASGVWRLGDETARERGGRAPPAWPGLTVPLAP